MIKNPELYVAQGILAFAKALINTHHVNKINCFNELQMLIQQEKLSS